MANISYYLQNAKRKMVNVYVRVSCGRGKSFRAKTFILCYSDSWSDAKKTVKIPTIASKEKIEYCKKVLIDLENLKTYLLEHLNKIEKTALSLKTIQNLIESYSLKTIDHTEDLNDFFGLYHAFFNDRKKEIVDARHYLSTEYILHRYELYSGEVLNVNQWNDSTLQSLFDFMKNEHIFYKDEAYAEMTKKYTVRKCNERGINIINTYFKKIRAFVNWYIKHGYCQNNPFDNFKVPAEKYGTPIFLTIEERNKLFAADLRMSLAIQRDIFVFQCLVGCRVGDLYSLTKESVQDDFIEYYPHKTIARPKSVRVPLNEQAKKIIARYINNGQETLFPFISEQKYNEAIKEMLKEAGIDRIVTVLNSSNNLPEQKHIYEVASSHMARRTFIGNLYKKVKDPNLIGSMTGHVDGSKAFSRYRTIDDDIKKELVSLL